MGSGSQVYVADGQGGELAGSQTCLAGECQHRLVPPSGPGLLVGCGEQRVDLVFGEVGDHRRGEDLGWHGQDPLDDRGVFGVA